mmetsp:Transcript_8697/g.22064  ORF Transcript_8697/g.22064 Transcript_8697/m.22064 type:complete len:276 (+) Transcript_8697:150-977(+)
MARTARSAALVAAIALALLALVAPACADGLVDAYDVDKASATIQQRLRGGIATDGLAATGEEGEHGTFVEANIRSFAMIIVSELGDETFIIAAIMAMRHPRAVVLTGALGALYVMTVLSAAMGYVMPKLISPEITHKIATFMYFFFGFRLLWIAYHASTEEAEEEIEEVEKALKSDKKNKSALQRFLSRICTQVFIEAFILTFLAEWGDRSQIATITLAAHNDPLGVIIGSCVGHSICTAIAVFGGRLIATQISQRTVALAGSFTFFVFAFLNLM